MSAVRKIKLDAAASPWTYHAVVGRKHGGWIEDCNGKKVLENVGPRDGLLICACVNKLAGNQ